MISTADYNDNIEEDALLITNANNALNKELLDFINPIFKWVLTINVPKLRN